MEAAWEEVECELCAVCYETFYEEVADEEEKPVRLSCGHYSHTVCFRENTSCIYFCEQKRSRSDDN